MDIPKNRGTLMLASFLTLIAAGMGFITRAAAGPAWATEFNISGATFGMIMGAGFTGFGVFIFLGGMLVEAVGYKRLLLTAVVLHIVSAVMLVIAPSWYTSALAGGDQAAATESVTTLLFWSVFLFAVCNGLYEAVINPLVGQLYPRKSDALPEYSARRLAGGPDRRRCPGGLLPERFGLDHRGPLAVRAGSLLGGVDRLVADVFERDVSRHRDSRRQSQLWNFV